MKTSGQRHPPRQPNPAVRDSQGRTRRPSNGGQRWPRSRRTGRQRFVASEFARQRTESGEMHHQGWPPRQWLCSRSTLPDIDAQRFRSFSSGSVPRELRRGTRFWQVHLTTKTVSSRRTLSPGAADRVRESARQFCDSIWLPSTDRFPGDEVSANTKRRRSGLNEVERGHLIYTAGGNQWHAGKHSLQVPNVIVASDVSARNNFDKIGAQFPSGDDIGWSKAPGDHDDILLYREPNRIRIKPVAGQECGARIQAAPRRFYVEDTSCTDNDLFWSVFHQVRKNFDGVGHRESDFHQRNSAARHRFRREQSILSRRHTNGRDDSDFLDPAAHVLLVHRGPSLRGIEADRFLDWCLRLERIGQTTAMHASRLPREPAQEPASMRPGLAGRQVEWRDSCAPHPGNREGSQRPAGRHTR